MLPNEYYYHIPTNKIILIKEIKKSSTCNGQPCVCDGKYMYNQKDFLTKEQFDKIKKLKWK